MSFQPVRNALDTTLEIRVHAQLYCLFMSHLSYYKKLYFLSAMTFEDMFPKTLFRRQFSEHEATVGLLKV